MRDRRQAEIGGGLSSNLLMTFYGRPIHQAVATSSALAVLISIPGALGYVYAGWPAGPGVRVAHPMSKRTLEAAFGCYLFIVGSIVIRLL
jgi:uncharacterized membrane protein YfcA